MQNDDLIARCQRREDGAFNEFVLKYQNMVYSVALNTIGNREDAQDAAQEVFLRIYKSLHSFRGEAGVGTWIYRIIHNVCVDLLRKRTHSPVSIDDDEGAFVYLEDHRPGPSEIAESKEREHAVSRAITRLGEDKRTALVLRDIKGLSYKEISAITGASEGTVKSRIARAREALRNILLDGNFFSDFRSN